MGEQVDGRFAIPQTDDPFCDGRYGHDQQSDDVASQNIGSQSTIEQCSKHALRPCSSPGTGRHSAGSPQVEHGSVPPQESV